MKQIIMAKKQKYYVVWQGHEPGVYASWGLCQVQTKNFPDAKYKAFPSREAAEDAYLEGYHNYIGRGATKAKTKKPTLDTLSAQARSKIVWDSISVDAACSGNPGVMEYQGVNTKTGERLFYQKFPLGTNNIGEFLAIIHALARFSQTGNTTPIYTDSKIAMGWVRKKKCNTKLKHAASTKNLHEVIKRGENWLKTHTYANKIMKWDTENWGEIPADFGRK